MELKPIAEMKSYLLLGTFFALTAVILGAFGSHSLKNKIEKRYLDAFEIGVRYQLAHGLALLIISITALFFTSKFISISQILMCLGTFVFSASLYLYALSGNSFFGMVTPIGGTLLIAGWVFYVLAIYIDLPGGY